jgi:hypothetical protein
LSRRALEVLFFGTAIGRGMVHALRAGVLSEGCRTLSTTL